MLKLLTITKVTGYETEQTLSALDKKSYIIYLRPFTD